MLWEFPGGPVVRIHASIAGARFSLWAGDQNPETVTKHGQKKKKKKRMLYRRPKSEMLTSLFDIIKLNLNNYLGGERSVHQRKGGKTRGRAFKK